MPCAPPATKRRCRWRTSPSWSPRGCRSPCRWTVDSRWWTVLPSPAHRPPATETCVRLAARSTSQRVLATTSVVHLLNDACFAILYPLFPLIAADLGLSYAQVGLVKTAFSGASSVLQLPA